MVMRHAHPPRRLHRLRSVESTRSRRPVLSLIEGPAPLDGPALLDRTAPVVQRRSLVGVGAPSGDVAEPIEGMLGCRSRGVTDVGEGGRRDSELRRLVPILPASPGAPLACPEVGPDPPPD
jgi:hypothetical protein